jgi:mycofactocin system transcriptional regulator
MREVEVGQSRLPNRTALPGRPVVTTHAAIEQVAFQLFAEQGFEGTTLEDIARRAGVSRRTIIRYFSSKNDIPWGHFSVTLDHFRKILSEMPTDLPLWQAVHCGVVRFNDFPPDANPSHLARMKLILETPALLAHSVLRYAEWRSVIADYVAVRLNLNSTDPTPVVVGHVSLALALSAYERWLTDPQASLTETVDEAMATLRAHLA